MTTPIGQCLRSRVRLRVLFTALALTAVSIDFWFAAHAYPDWTRAVLSAVVLALYLLSGTVDRGSLGLRLAPVQPVASWIRFTAIVGVLMLLPIVAFWAVAGWMGLRLTAWQIAPDQAASRFLHMCLIAPVVEESLYRLVLCFPATATIGSTGAILLSGAAFAGLHFAYGNPGPDNFVAGYVLAWAYLKCGSITVPITLHSLGNGVAFAIQISAWYAAQPAG